MTGPAPKADPRAVLGRHLPWLVPGAITVLAAGWDSDAYALDGRIVVKRPKNAPAELRLRREAALLAVVRPAVTLPVPDLHLVSGPPLFSWHRMLPGQQLLAGGYAGLAAGAQVRLAQDLGRFLAELHRIDLAQARAVGAVDLVPWRGATQVLALAMPVLPASKIAPRSLPETANTRD